MEGYTMDWAASRFCLRVLMIVTVLMAGGILPARQDLFLVGAAPTHQWRPPTWLVIEEPPVQPWRVNKYICPPSLCGELNDGEGENLDESNLDGTVITPSEVRLQAFNFIEGDIVPSQNQGSTRRKRAIVRPVTKFWTYGIIPYSFDSKMSSKMKHYIRSAFRHYERKTCLRFRKKTKDDVNYIRYISEPGCWSYVGMEGGRQLLSLGNGCEYFGTAVHETGHALGFWHEQARRDRDDYIKIKWDNIASYYREQFDVRAENETMTRGFPYDYYSIMHYGKDVFTRNGQDTMKIIGVGKQLRPRPKLGQHNGLSDLDIAQINSMYYCNDKAMQKSACEEGWVRFKKSCYKFTKTKLHFRGAEDKCFSLGARLLHINNEAEDMYIKNHLLDYYFNNTHWRTGGKKMDGTYGWSRESSKPFTMRYTAWAPDHPGRYTSMALVQEETEEGELQYVWKGVWVGSEEQLPSFGYPYICEKPANISCVSEDTRGQDYRGEMSYTAQGLTCQKWTALYPHNHTLITGDTRRDEEFNGLGDHNYCRNPNAMRSKPWCFTTLTDTKWQYCDFEVCNGETGNGQTRTAMPTSTSSPTDRQQGARTG